MPPTSRPLRVAVAGAGFAGLAAAALLARRGHAVEVFGKFKSPRALGAGILLQPIGLAALETMGIAQEIAQRAARVDRLLGLSHIGTRVVDIRYADWREGAFGLGVHRGVLFNALWSLAMREGVRVHVGQEVRDLAALRASHDLTVIADGCRSSLRCQTGLASTDRVYPWGAMWAVLPDPEREWGTTLHQWYRGASQMLGIMPTGQAPGSQTPVVSLFWSLRADRLTLWRDAGLDRFKQQMLALNPRGGALLERLTSMEQLTWAQYHDVSMPIYHGEGCVVIGDAAHATSPQLGQGTNLALLDALALDQCLAASSDVNAALAAYTALRRPHLHFYSDASRRLTPLFQSDARMLSWLRDLFMGIGSRAPIARRISLETLVGVRQGWWRAPSLTVATGPAPAVQVAA